MITIPLDRIWIHNALNADPSIGYGTLNDGFHYAIANPSCSEEVLKIRIKQLLEYYLDHDEIPAGIVRGNLNDNRPPKYIHQEFIKGGELSSARRDFWSTLGINPILWTRQTSVIWGAVYIHDGCSYSMILGGKVSGGLRDTYSGKPDGEPSCGRSVSFDCQPSVQALEIDMSRYPTYPRRGPPAPIFIRNKEHFEQIFGRSDGMRLGTIELPPVWSDPKFNSQPVITNQESDQMTSLVQLAKVVDASLHDNSATFGALPESIRTALTESIAEEKKTASKNAATQIIGLLKDHDSKIDTLVSRHRELNRELALLKTQMNSLNRARDYGLESTNFVPLALELGKGSARELADIDVKLRTVPADWVKKEAAPVPQDTPSADKQA